MSESFIQWVIETTSATAGRPGNRWASRWSTRSRPTRRPRSACSMRRTAPSPGPARWPGMASSTGGGRPAVRRLAHDYATVDAIPALQPSPLDLAAYRDSVLARFGNAVLADTVQRVASDSWAKLGGFVAPRSATSSAAARRSMPCRPAGAVPSVPAALATGRTALRLRGRRDRAEALRALCDAGDPVAVLCGAPRPVGPAGGRQATGGRRAPGGEGGRLAWPQFGGATTAVTSGANRRRGRPTLPEPQPRLGQGRRVDVLGVELGLLGHQRQAGHGEGAAVEQPDVIRTFSG